MKVSESGGDFQTVEVGNYIARCYKLLDIGTQEGSYEGKVTFKRQIVLGWEFPTELMEDGQPLTASAFFTASLNENAKLRPFLKDWRGKDFTPEELEAFEMKNLLGAPCMLNMVKNKKGKVVPGAATPMPKGIKCDPQMNPTQYFSLDPEEYDQAAFDKLTDWFQKTVRKSPEFAAITSGTSTATTAAVDDTAEEEDIPF